MRDLGIVSGDKEQALPLIVGKNTVYVHTDIQKVEVDNGDGTKHTEWQYHEVQYGKDEYLKKISEEKAELESQTTDLQLALIEVFEDSSTAKDDLNKQVTDLQLALIEVYETMMGGTAQ